MNEGNMALRILAPEQCLTTLALYYALMARVA
jgi:hypothetical protein